MTLPHKDPAFRIREREPLNGGAPADRLVAHPITPADHFFVRNHGAVPQVDPASYRLSVTGMLRRPLLLSVPELRRQFSSATVEAAIECAGNRRTELMAIAPVPGELPWEAEAVGNAEWTGVRLADVLAAAGVLPAAAHVAFTGLDQVVKGPDRFPFGGSIPLEKASAQEVLLAFSMNGGPLGLEHGFPLRVVVPGYIGARSVKWLAEIAVQDRPSANYFQTRAYKIFPPEVRADTADWDAGRMLGEIPVNSVIAAPPEGARGRPGKAYILGYALGGAARIAAVEVSLDGGQIWQEARRHDRESPWAWCLWEVETDLPAGVHELVVRARDQRGNTQPPDLRSVWNFKGYANNAWHRVRVTRS